MKMENVELVFDVYFETSVYIELKNKKVYIGTVTFINIIYLFIELRHQPLYKHIQYYVIIKT